MTGGTVETHVFIGSVGSDQGSVQTGLHVVNLLIVLWNTHRTHTTTSALVGLKHRGKKRWTGTDCDDVEEVVISQRVQYGGDRLPGDGQPQALHAPTDVH